MGRRQRHTRAQKVSEKFHLSFLNGKRKSIGQIMTSTSGIVKRVRNGITVTVPATNRTIVVRTTISVESKKYWTRLIQDHVKPVRSASCISEEINL
jgi:hypothetical protein